MFNYLLVRYGEIGLKGKNRSMFIKSLVDNIKASLTGLDVNKVYTAQGRLYIPLNGEYEQLKAVQDRITKVFGIVSVSPAVKVESNLDKIKDTALQVFESSMRDKYTENVSQSESSDGAAVNQRKISFKVDCRRADKTFVKNSMEMNKLLGAHIMENFPDLTVDVHTPDITVWVEIREDGTFLYTDKISGHGGLPVGTTGDGILLLSGGIDSPVAGWVTMKRGVRVTGLHFHSYPFTSERALKKVEDISQIISRFGAGSQGSFKLIVNHFTEIQKAIQTHCSENMWVTVMRRFMFKIANRLAHENGALTVITGENVGQVASQTLESMQAVSHYVDIPVLRPLAGMDKKDIMKSAETIGTYEISIRPYEDCCTLFLPENPKTRPTVRQTDKEMNKLDVEGLVTESLEQTTVKYFQPYSENYGELDLNL